MLGEGSVCFLHLRACVSSMWWGDVFFGVCVGGGAAQQDSHYVRAADHTVGSERGKIKQLLTNSYLKNKSKVWPEIKKKTLGNQ